jgi:hypothetical protein
MYVKKPLTNLICSMVSGFTQNKSSDEPVKEHQRNKYFGSQIKVSGEQSIVLGPLVISQ